MASRKKKEATPTSAPAPAPTPKKASPKKVPPKNDAAAAPAVKKTDAKKPSKDGVHKKHKPNYESYGSYIYKVLRRVHPNIGITGKSLAIMDTFVHDILEKIANESASILKHAHKQTLSAREIQLAVRMHIPGTLGSHAISEGAKAVTKYAENTPDL
jgi:histone H2B